MGFVNFLRQKKEFLTQYVNENCLLQEIVCKVKYLSPLTVGQFWSWVVLSSIIICETVTVLWVSKYLFALSHSGGEEFTIQFKWNFAETLTGKMLDRCRLSIIINSQEEISLSPTAQVWTPSLLLVNRWVIDSFVDALRGDMVGSIQGHTQDTGYLSSIYSDSINSCKHLLNRRNIQPSKWWQHLFSQSMHDYKKSQINTPTLSSLCK